MNYQITDDNKQHLVEWLKDRNQFSIWSVSIISTSFVVLTVFGNNPGFNQPAQVMLSISLVLMLFALIANFVTAWSIPGWKLKLQTGQLTDTKRMYYEISINTWISVILYVSGLTLGFIGNVPM